MTGTSAKANPGSASAVEGTSSSCGATWWRAATGSTGSLVVAIPAREPGLLAPDLSVPPQAGASLWGTRLGYRTARRSWPGPVTMGCMQALAIGAPDARVRRPSVLELSAAGMLATAVILHLVALIPQYYGGPGQGSLWSEPDQAAQYLLLSAGWALALGVALTGPARVRLGAAIAVGVAATEFGFRLSDLGEVFRYGSAAAAAPGLWLMTAAWVVGAAGAVLAVLAVHAQRGSASLAAAPGSTREESSAGFGVAGGHAGPASALSGPGGPQPVPSAGGSSATAGAAPSFAAPEETQMPGGRRPPRRPRHR